MGQDEDLSSLCWGVTATFVVFTVASFILRVYSRAVVIKCFGIDDWLATFAFIIWIGQCYICWAWLAMGGGKHTNVVSSENIAKMKLYLFVEEFYYPALQLFIKLSFLFFFRRIWTSPRMVARAIIAVMVLVCFQIAGTILFYALQCIPIQAYLHPERYPNAKCLSSEATLIFPSAANVAVDVVIYLLPLWPLWNLHTSRRRRIALMSMFTFGGAAVLVSGLRFIVLFEFSASPDFTYVLGKIVIITMIEFCISIITLNMPSFKAVWSKHVTGTFLGSKGSLPNYELSAVSHNLHSKDRRSSQLQPSLTSHKRNNSELGTTDRMIWANTSEVDLLDDAEAGKNQIKVTSDLDVNVSRQSAWEQDDSPTYPPRYFYFKRDRAA